MFIPRQTNAQGNFFLRLFVTMANNRDWKDRTNKPFNKPFFNIAPGNHTIVELRRI